MKTLAKLSIIGGVLIVVLSGSAEAGGFKVKSLGKFQQKALAKVAGGVAGAYVGTAVTPVAGPLAGGAVGGAVSHAVGNHAEKKWTGKGLKNIGNYKKW